MPFSILIVDDSAVVRRTLRTCFREETDWEVCGEACNGLEAIEKAGHLKPDLIVLDLSMPGMNGLEAARVLKLARPTIPIVMFTSFKETVLEHQALAAGCSAVIGKSELPLLFSNIRRLLLPPQN